ncbi:MAG: hypothetical protein PVH29_09725 [Candidatus Zixiibacteriota bacterium]|jgi:opacity protein-like surface antigen
MKRLIVIALGFGLALTGPAAFAQDEEEPPAEEKLPGYLPGSIYPGVYVFGGKADGPTYDGAEGISNIASKKNNPSVLEDIGTLPAFGVGFDFYFWRGLSMGLKLTHEIGTRRAIALKYETDEVFYEEESVYTRDAVFEERISYRYQNVDYKLGLKFAFFHDWPVTPYAWAGLGGNLTRFDTQDEVSDPAIQKRLNGFLVGTETIKQFSFDYALAAGVQVNIGDSLFFILEYEYDQQFRKHTVAGYEYDTSFEGYFAGVGWRFPG